MKMFTQMQVRITASNAHGLYTYWRNNHPAEKWAEKLEKMYFSTFGGSSDTRYGTRMERKARKLYKVANPRLISNVGFVINIKCPWLGASPDGIACENGELIYLEVKSLKVGKRLTGQDFLERANCLQKDADGMFTLRRRNKFFTQIQLGLALTNLKKAKLVLYVGRNNSIICINVLRDDAYISDVIETLTHVYFTYCLQFLAQNEGRLEKV